MRRRFTLLAGLMFTFIICATSAIITIMFLESNDKGSFEPLSQDAITAFNDQYDIAFQQGEAWTAEPPDIALRYTCGEECGGESVAVEMPGSDKAVVFVEDHTTFDDSIKAIKHRLEFISNGPRWTLEWGGWKQQCRRDDWTAIFQGRFGWHTRLCP